MVEAWEATETVHRLGRFGVEDTASVNERRLWRRGDKFGGGEEADAYPESEAAGEEGTGLVIVDHERRADRIPAAQETDQERLDAQRASTALRIAAGKSWFEDSKDEVGGVVDGSEAQVITAEQLEEHPEILHESGADLALVSTARCNTRGITGCGGPKIPGAHAQSQLRIGRPPLEGIGRAGETPEFLKELDP